MSSAPWDDPAEDVTADDVTADDGESAEAPTTIPVPEGHEPGQDEAGEYECPECGKRFKRPMHRGLHRKRHHGILGTGTKEKTPKNRGGAKRRSSASAGTADAPPSGSEGRRKRVIKETLLELADLADSALGRMGAVPQNLTEIVRRDSDKQATAIAGLASRFEPLGALIDLVFGAGGPLSFVLAFGPTARKLRELAGERKRLQAQADAEAWEQMQQVPPEYQGQGVDWGSAQA